LFIAHAMPSKSYLMANLLIFSNKKAGFFAKKGCFKNPKNGSK